MEHPLESSLENAFSTLSKLGIVDSISYDYSSYYRLLIELKNIPEHVSNRGKFDDPPLSEMISVFVGVIDHFDVLSTEREPFQPILHRNALRLLAETGYAEKLDDRYRWTDKIAAAMRENVVWNEAGESYRALHDADIDQAIETMWETMPDTIRRRFGADPERVVLIDLIRAISRCWRDGEWVNPSENAGRFFMPSETVDIARGLLRKFKENPK